ncbi:protein BPS1, chloroplastic-like [Impatiens glandulifera]|uniref:protein BPS1, chloroplastic-like n=1 Tax=Impatiens glandulifera TaxID=253017 RepID=UPI001FB187C7|nr:protein BPS1, chloroplastic-like [Impatiens glandulifera]
MSKPQEPQRHHHLFQFGNPFKMMLPKGSNMSPKLLTMTNNFGITLADRLKNLKPKDMDDLLSLPWMRLAVNSLCETHTDIKTFINKLELPVCDWDEKWINIYFNSTVKILDICIAFSSELSHLTQGHLLLQFLLHKLETETKPTIQSSKVQESLDYFRQHMSSKNQKLADCFNILDTLTQDMILPKSKLKNSSKEKALMHALYGVQVHTLFVCNILAAGFAGSSEKIIDLHVPETFLWADAFVDVQNCINGEIRRMLKTNMRSGLVKEVEAIDNCLKKLEPLLQDGDDLSEIDLEKSSIDLGQKREKLSQGLDLMIKGVDGFFRIILTGRDALLSNLRADFVSESYKIDRYSVVKFQVVR